MRVDFLLFWWWRGSIVWKGSNGCGEKDWTESWITVSMSIKPFCDDYAGWRLGHCLDKTVFTLHALRGRKISLQVNNHIWYNCMSDSVLFHEGEKTCHTTHCSTEDDARGLLETFVMVELLDLFFIYVEQSHTYFCFCSLYLVQQVKNNAWTETEITNSKQYSPETTPDH